MCQAHYFTFSGLVIFPTGVCVCVPCCYLFLLLLTKLKHCYTDLTANNFVLNFGHLASMIFVMQGFSGHVVYCCYCLVILHENM